MVSDGAIRVTHIVGKGRWNEGDVSSSITKHY